MSDFVNAFRAGREDRYQDEQRANKKKFNSLASGYATTPADQQQAVGTQMFAADPQGAEAFLRFNQNQTDAKLATDQRQAKITAHKLYAVSNAPEGQAEGTFQAIAPDEYQKAIQSGLITQDMPAPQRDQLIRQTAAQHLPAYMAQAGISTAPELKSVAEGGSLVAVSPMGGAPTTSYTAPPKPTISNVNPGDFTPESLKKYQSTNNYSDLVRMYKPSEGSGAAASSIDAYKNDPTLRRTAAVVVASDPARMRDYATFGAAGQGIRTAINQEIGQLKKETGMSDGDFVSLRARAKADASNLTKLTAQNAQIEQAEGLLKANGQRALDLINMVDATGIPLIEGFRRSAKAKMGGVNEAELKSVMTAFQTEAARLLTSGPTMNGVISDSARHEVANMSPENMSADQAKRVINRIFTEADIRHGLNLDQINKASSGIPVGATPTPQAAPTPQPQTPQSGPVKVSTPQEAMALPPGTQFVTPDGRVKVRP